jgi:FKBP-type peptidyl-prolyl cis-trans isomerase
MRITRLFTALLPLAFAACLTAPEPRAAVPIESTTFAPNLGVNLAASTKTASGMYIRDVTVGTGAVFAAGDSITVRYEGAFANGSVFDSTIDPSRSPFSFKLGVGRVIPGWDEGVVGMKIGGVRQLVIPPSLGYGPNDYGPIPGNSVLVFNVQAIAKN